MLGCFCCALEDHGPCWPGQHSLCQILRPHFLSAAQPVYDVSTAWPSKAKAKMDDGKAGAALAPPLFAVCRARSSVPSSFRFSPPLLPSTPSSLRKPPTCFCFCFRRGEIPNPSPHHTRSPNLPPHPSCSIRHGAAAQASRIFHQQEEGHPRGGRIPRRPLPGRKRIQRRPRRVPLRSRAHLQPHQIQQEDAQEAHPARRHPPRLHRPQGGPRRHRIRNAGHAISRFHLLRIRLLVRCSASYEHEHEHDDASPSPASRRHRCPAVIAAALLLRAEFFVASVTRYYCDCLTMPLTCLVLFCFTYCSSAAGTAGHASPLVHHYAHASAAGLVHNSSSDLSTPAPTSLPTNKKRKASGKTAAASASKRSCIAPNTTTDAKGTHDNFPPHSLIKLIFILLITKHK